jgi:hypothetical protein
MIWIYQHFTNSSIFGIWNLNGDNNRTMKKRS